MVPGDVPLPNPVQNEIPVVNARPRRNHNRRQNPRMIVRLPLRTNERVEDAPPVEDAPSAEPPRDAQPRNNGDNESGCIRRRTGHEHVSMQVTVPSRLVASISGGVEN
ncbi:uncharacterized protein LOC118263347 [Spodoptera frugiperda]|uniref:Uncharacterized protein LOC118263347 n=1 Tax=Spodoptera frugiperda TaxID=7108 RepID=A0A9R0CW13_SPOFR|nr:uncharacterized protein LOC118263347 [Spodoptera frugiperda]